MKVRSVFTLLLLLSVISCSVNQEGMKGDEALIRPDMELSEGEFTLYQRGESPIVFTAERALFYSMDNKAVIENISFMQRDEEGSLILEGSARNGELDTEKEILRLEGEVMLNSIRNEMEIWTDGVLYFNTNTQEIETDSKVHITSSDGEFSSLSFYGNLLTEEYSFSTLESGRIMI